MTKLNILGKEEKSRKLDKKKFNTQFFNKFKSCFYFQKTEKYKY